MTDLTSLCERMAHALVFNVACHRTHSRGSQRRFFAQMRRALGASGYAMSHWRGLCVVVPLHEQDLRTGRHDVLNWLSDQLETAKVIVHLPMRLSEVLTGDFTVTEMGKKPLGPLLDGVAHELIRRIAAGAVTQGLQRLQRPRHGDPTSCSSTALP
jgi:hypothetical protein